MCHCLTKICGSVRTHPRRGRYICVNQHRGQISQKRGEFKEVVMEEVRVLGLWASPYSFRVEEALKMKGVEYEYAEIDIMNKTQELLDCNPVHKKVPVLLHTGKPIAESLVIMEYIDQVWKGESLLPSDPYERAQARFWAKFIDDQVCLL